MAENMNMDFSEALFLLRAGCKVRRKSWIDRYAYVWIDEKDEAVYLKFSDGIEATIEVTTKMVIARDWQEVEK